MTTLQRGRKAVQAPIEIGEIRSLTRADLAVLAEPRPANSIQTLRDNHHRIARAIASGLSNYEVAEACGISYTRVSMHKADPAMIELVAHYRGIITSEWAKEADPVAEKLRAIRGKALAMIEDKIDDAAEKNEFLPSRDLATFAEMGLDRTGYGKERKNVNVNMDFAAMLEKARKRSSVVESARVIGSQSAVQSAPAPVSQASAPRPEPPPSRLRRF